MRIEDKWYYFPVIISVLYFFYRLIDYSKLAYIFPLEKTNDVASYIAQLYFLANYGFHQIIPYWENGFILFESYPPGWFYFALPLYHLFNDYLIATFGSIVLMFVIIFLAINYLGKVKRMSLIKRVGFFIFLFGNPIAIGNFIRLGRVTELFGWMSFVILSVLFLLYVDKELDLKFYLIFIIFYSVLMLSHPAIIVVFLILLVSLFISRTTWKDRILLILSSLAVYIITSFWWVSFVLTLDRADTSIVTEGLLHFNKAWLWTSVASLIVPVILWISFYFYWKDKKKGLLFFIPIFITSLLFFSRAIILVPILNNVYPDVYMLMFLFFGLYYFLSTKEFPKIGELIKIGLVVLAVVSILVSYYHTPMVRDYTIHEDNAVELLGLAEGKFFVFGIPGSGFHDNGGYLPAESSNMYNYYSYAPVYYNLSSVSPVIFSGSSGYGKTLLWDTMRFGTERNCSEFREGLEELGTDEILTFEEHCEFLIECGFEFKASEGSACLFLS